MYKTLMLSLVLLASAAWLQAQAYPQSGSNPSSSASSGQTSGTTAGQMKVEGCLQSSGGNYTLSDKNGTTWQLAGDTAKLADHVGHEVQITGSTGAGSASSASAASSGGSQTLEVKSVKHISKTCTSSMSK